MGATDLEMAGRLCLAALLGGLVGLEREVHSQPAGLRTHMIVGLGSCLIMLVSLHMTDLARGGRTPPASRPRWWPASASWAPGRS